MSRMERKLHRAPTVQQIIDRLSAFSPEDKVLCTWEGQYTHISPGILWREHDGYSFVELDVEWEADWNEE